MQDNEFDEIFRSKLDKFEAAPSANVWNGIAAELNAGKHKNALLPFLSIAASIIVLVTAGVLFIPQKREPIVKHIPKNNLTKVAGELTSSRAIKNSSSPVIPKTPAVKLNETNIAANKHIPARHLEAGKGIQVQQAVENSVPDKSGDQPELASTVQKQQDAIKAVVPDEPVRLAVNQASAETTQPVLQAAQATGDNKPGAALVKPGHKVRNFGDLLNAAVAKIDKRMDKFIQFTNDDDETTVTGINLGIIKIKKGE